MAILPVKHKSIKAPTKEKERYSQLSVLKTDAQPKEREREEVEIEKGQKLG